ncbi:hypothetical protein cyc_07788 [Cyclospora cayetanensis]|uniref:Uncharacterized protein n=1 Tax=Cyclospora cayetanensis TaxID=88456 RepID=A0A1D3CRH6_9EIME|nr:hypothetical protein cyc_07788 [Cyclospora cayetanensis]
MFGRESFGAYAQTVSVVFKGYMGQIPDLELPGSPPRIYLEAVLPLSVVSGLPSSSFPPLVSCVKAILVSPLGRKRDYALTLPLWRPIEPLGDAIKGGLRGESLVLKSLERIATQENGSIPSNRMLLSTETAKERVSLTLRVARQARLHDSSQDTRSSPSQNIYNTSSFRCLKRPTETYSPILSSLFPRSPLLEALLPKGTASSHQRLQVP